MLHFCYHTILEVGSVKLSYAMTSSKFVRSRKLAIPFLKHFDSISGSKTRPIRELAQFTTDVIAAYQFYPNSLRQEHPSIELYFSTIRKILISQLPFGRSTKHYVVLLVFNSGFDQNNTVLDETILFRIAYVIDYDYNFDSTFLIVLGLASLLQRSDALCPEALKFGTNTGWF